MIRIHESHLIRNSMPQTSYSWEENLKVWKLQREGRPRKYYTIFDTWANLEFPVVWGFIELFVETIFSFVLKLRLCHRIIATVSYRRMKKEMEYRCFLSLFILVCNKEHDNSYECAKHTRTTYTSVHAGGVIFNFHPLIFPISSSLFLHQCTCYFLRPLLSLSPSTPSFSSLLSHVLSSVQQFTNTRSNAVSHYLVLLRSLHGQR